MARVVHLVRSLHGVTGLVAVSLGRDPGDGRVQITAPGRVRVVHRDVADRLGRLVDAASAHACASDQPLQLDLDELVHRAEADVARRDR